MKKFAYILGALLVLFSGDLATAEKASDPGLKRASELCSLVTKAPKIPYEEIFDDSLKGVLPPLVITQILESIYKEHSNCFAATRLGKLESPDGVRIYLLQLKDGSRSVFKLRTATNEKINHLQYEQELPPENYPLESRELFVPLSDGTLLHTYIFGKDLSQRKPIILERTPYLHMDSLPNYAFFGTAPYYLNQGYHFVVQAVRGTAGSQGDYHFLSPKEIDDGYETVEWIAKQGFSDGKVAVTGTSFDGFTAMAAAVRNPKALKVVLAGGYAVDIFTDGFVRNGIVLMAMLDYFRYSQFDLGLPFSPDFTQKLLSKVVDIPDLREYDKLLYGKTISEWQLIAENLPNPESSFWKTREILTRLPEIQVPTYHIAGMRQDGDMPDVVRGFTYVERNSSYKSKHHLILGYWDHGNSTPYSDGSQLAPFLKDRFPSLLAYYLKGEPSQYAKDPRVQVASNSSTNFIGSDSFPPPGLREQTLYFRNSGGGLKLSEVKPTTEQTFFYQMLPLTLNLSLESKQTLTFLKKMESDTPLLGPVSFDIYATISTPQTEIIAIISKLDKDGKEQFVSNCIAAKKVFSSGSIAHIHLDLCPVLNLVKAGETIKVIVTSNLFPTFARNTNNAIDHYYDGFSNADITLYSSKKYPSRMQFNVEPTH